MIVFLRSLELVLIVVVRDQIGQYFAWNHLARRVQLTCR